MKFIWIFYIFLINQVLLQINYDLGKDQALATDSAVIFFDATNFNVNDNIYLIITGNFKVEYIDYTFEDDLPAYANNLDTKGFILKREYYNKIKERTDIGEDYQERYFTIEKTQDKIKSGQEGKYLIIYPYMNGLYDIENTNTNKGNSKVISEKYKTVETENPIIFFDTSDFKVGDEIYLIISGEFMFDDDEIYYAFIDDISTTEDFYFEVEISNKVEAIKDRGDDYESKYYTIKKTKEAIKEGEGKYLLLLIYMHGKYKIENTEENKGNTNLIIIVVVVVVVVIAVILFIICYCRRKKQAAINQENYQYNNNVKVYNNGYNTNDQVYKDGNQGFNNNPNYNNNNDPNFGPQNSNYPQF